MKEFNEITEDLIKHLEAKECKNIEEEFAKTKVMYFIYKCLESEEKCDEINALLDREENKRRLKRNDKGANQ